MKKSLSYGTKRLVVYGTLGILSVALSLIILNSVLLGISMYRYEKTDKGYSACTPKQIAVALQKNGDTYSLSKDYQKLLATHKQWAILIDQEGNVVWEYDKPKEVKKHFTLTEVAAFSKWYLNDYPVTSYIWKDMLMVIGGEQNSSWKYNLLFSIDFVNYMVKWVPFFILLNIIWIILVAIIIMRFWTKGKEEARMEWIGGISHDIRTPLSMVMGYAAALEENEEVEGKAHEQAAIICRQSKVIKELVSDLNLTSKLTYSMQPLRKEIVNIAALLREVAISYLNDDLEQKIEIDMQIDKEVEGVRLKCDCELLRRALMNLIGNSIRHNNSRDHIKITISALLEHRRLHLIIADDGEGYSKEMLQKLRSRREDDPIHIGGLGIVKKVIAAHHGKISFCNREGEGSECSIWLNIED